MGAIATTTASSVVLIYYRYAFRIQFTVIVLTTAWWCGGLGDHHQFSHRKITIRIDIFLYSTVGENFTLYYPDANRNIIECSYTGRYFRLSWALHHTPSPPTYTPQDHHNNTAANLPPLTTVVTQLLPITNRTMFKSWAMMGSTLLALGALSTVRSVFFLFLLVCVFLVVSPTRAATVVEVRRG